jgi:flagellar biosynthesis/type III secretory pathway protein FliH
MAARREAGLMTIAHLLDEFECQIPEYSPAAGRAGAVEDVASLDLYEQGYKAGWEDCVAAYSVSSEKATAGLKLHLSTLFFTFDAARLTVLQEISSVLTQVIEQILPMLLKQSFLPFVIERLDAMVEASAPAGLAISVNPSLLDRMEAALGQAFQSKITLVGDISLNPERALLKIGNSEIEVDFKRYLTEISEAFQNFQAVSDMGDPQ